MFTTTRYHNANSTRVSSANARGAALWRRLLAPILVTGAIMCGYEALLALASPGKVIRHDLIRAGWAVSGLPWSTPSDRVRQTVSRYFSGYRVSVDAAGFPNYVTVTLKDLGRNVCRDAYQEAGQVDGEVVIVAEGRADAACQDRAAITWRIMP